MNDEAGVIIKYFRPNFGMKKSEVNEENLNNTKREHREDG